MAAYYNEFDAYCAEWLRNLIAEGLIPYGHVDDRSIRDVEPSDLAGFTQCHFFAGLGGWGRALRLAKWRDDRPVWTGSCPCQPFSQAGKKLGFEDDRHLWPDWFRLIRELRPSVIFGEQVARAAGVGWLDTVADDLEGEAYAIGAAVLPACAVGAPHDRARLWFVAHTDGERQQRGSERDGVAFRPEQQASCGRDIGRRGSALAHGYGERSQAPRQEDARRAGSGLAGPDASRRGELLADAYGDNGQRRPVAQQMGRIGVESQAQWDGVTSRFEWPAEPDLPRVAHGVPARVAKLRALGNAIVPEIAAEFVIAYMELAL